jgi:hypothetical protein
MTIASLQRSPWSRITPKGYEPFDDDAVVGNNLTNDGSKEAGTGSKQGPLQPIVRIQIAKNYPEFPKKDLRAKGYIIDALDKPGNRSTAPPSSTPLPCPWAGA